MTKIRDLIKLITKKPDDCDDKYMKIRLNLDDELPPNKAIEISDMIIIAGAVIHENRNIIRRFSFMNVHINY